VTMTNFADRCDKEDCQGVGLEVARTVHEELEELGLLLEDWAAGLERRVLKLQQGGTPQGPNIPSDLAVAPPPRRQSILMPQPPTEATPAWQPVWTSEEQAILSTLARSKSTSRAWLPPSKDSSTPSTLEIPGVPMGSPRINTNLLDVGAQSTNSPEVVQPTATSPRSEQCVLAPRKSLPPTTSNFVEESLASRSVKKGRSMMQLYDLTNQFDKKVDRDLGAVSVKETTTSTLYNVVHCRAFTVVCSSLIMLNAILMGFQINSDIKAVIAKRNNDEEAAAWTAIEICFTVIFSIELVLRAISEKRMFWIGDEWKWNILDLLLVLLSIVDLATNEAVNSLPKVGFLRVLRFTRIVRIIRVMRFFQSFRLMIYSILNSMASLLWVFLLLLFVIYLFAIVFIHGVTEHFREGIDIRMEDSQFLADHFGTLATSLVSLFASICGGQDWQDVYLPLTRLGWAYGYIFIVYIFFVVFGVLNVVVGTFVDSAYQVSQRDRDFVVQCEVERNRKYMEDIKTFFFEADTDHSGMLTLEEFEAHLQKDKVKAYFQALQLDISQARALFMLLDTDASNEIELSEFIGGCMRMKGDAKSIDVNMLLFQNEKMCHQWASFMDYCTESFDRIEAYLGMSDNDNKKGSCAASECDTKKGSCLSQCDTKLGSCRSSCESPPPGKSSKQSTARPVPHLQSLTPR